MPAMAKEFLMNLPWGALGQAVAVLLMMQVQLLGMTSPLAVAWMCAEMNGGHVWLLWVGLTAGAWLCGGANWWVMPAAAAMMLGIAALGRRRRVGIAGDAALPMAGALALVDAVARSGTNPALAGQWLMCALATVAAAIPLLALRRGLGGQPLQRNADWRTRLSGRMMRASVGLAENAGAMPRGMRFVGGKRRKSDAAAAGTEPDPAHAAQTGNAQGEPAQRSSEAGAAASSRTETAAYQSRRAAGSAMDRRAKAAVRKAREFGGATEPAGSTGRTMAYADAAEAMSVESEAGAAASSRTETAAQKARRGADGVMDRRAKAAARKAWKFGGAMEPAGRTRWTTVAHADAAEVMSGESGADVEERRTKTDVERSRKSGGAMEPAWRTGRTAAARVSAAEAVYSRRDDVAADNSAKIGARQVRESVGVGRMSAARAEAAFCGIDDDERISTEGRERIFAARTGAAAISGGNAVAATTAEKRRSRLLRLANGFGREAQAGRANGNAEHDWATSRIGRWLTDRIAAARLDRTEVRKRNCPGAARSAPMDCPAADRPRTQEFPGREQALVDEGTAAWLGRAAIVLGVSAGAALALGGEMGVLLAAVSVVQWPERYGEALAALLAAVLAMSGVPMEAATVVIALWVALKLLERWPRPVQALGSLSAAGLWLLVGNLAQALGYLAALSPAAILVILLPERQSAAEATVAVQAQRLRMQRRNGEQLNALADVLTDMTQGHGSGLDPPQEDELLVSLRTRLCEGCVRYERCWNGRAGEGLRLLCELITKSVNGTLPERVLPDMMRRCMRANLIPNRLYAELNRFAQVRSARIARMDGVQRARLTIDTASQMLRSMAEAQICAGPPIDLRMLEAALRHGGMNGVSAALSPEGVVLSRAGGWPQEACERAQRICGRALGARYATEFCDGPALCLRPAPALVARIGWDGISAEDSRSGDSVHIGALDDRRQLVVISDGMGTGAAAAGESQRAVAAVRRFLQAGISPERAALMANQLLMSEGSGDMFATLDLCVIDNWRMEATWIKMAACDSFLLREHDGRVISGGRLPMGILAEAKPQVIVQRLLPGDVIVMGTDGAMEGLDMDTTQRCLISRRSVDAARLARALRQAGEERRIHTDDQTLAVIRMERADTIGEGNTRQARRMAGD